MEICIWDICNNRCQMCSNPDRPWPADDGSVEKDAYGYKKLTDRLIKLKSKIEQSDSIRLTGGEPTIHPRFLDILEFVRQTFPNQEIRLLTNARRFYYPDFARQVLAYHNLTLAVSLCGHNEELHEKVTRTKNSFNQFLVGLDNILKYRQPGQTVEIRTVVTKLTYKYMDKILDLVKTRFPQVDRTIVMFIEIEGQAEKNLKDVAVSYEEAKPYLARLYPYFSDLTDLRMYHFPLCTVDFKIWPYVWRTLPEKEIIFAKKCNKCDYKKYCLGIHNGFAAKMGTADLRPIKEKISIIETGDWHHPIAEANQ